MPSLRIVSTKQDQNIQTVLFLKGKPIWVDTCFHYSTHDRLVELERIVTSLLVSLNERELTIADVSEILVGVSTIPPLYQTKPNGHESFSAMVIASQDALKTDENLMTTDRVIENLIAFAEQAEANAKLLAPEEFPGEIMDRVDEPDPLTMKDREAWIEQQEQAYMKEHPNETASPLDVARRRLHAIRTGSRSDRLAGGDDRQDGGRTTGEVG